MLDKYLKPVFFGFDLVVRLRAFLLDLSNRFALLSLAIVVFFIAIVTTDRDISNSHDFYGYYYLCLVAFFLTFTVREIWRLMTSVVLSVSLAFVLFLWLSPFWTGGMDYGEWKQLGRRSLEIYTCALIVSGAVYYQVRLIRLVPFIMALMLSLTALFSIFRFFFLTNRFAMGDRLVTFPWPNENTGPEIYGLFIAGYLFYALSPRDSQWGMGRQALPSQTLFRLPQIITRILAMGEACIAPFERLLNWLDRHDRAVRIVSCAVCLLLFVDIVLASTRAAMVGLAGCVALYLLVSGGKILRHKAYILAFIAALGLVYAGLAVLNVDVLKLMFRGASFRDQLLVGFWNIAVEEFWLGHGMQNEFKYKVAGYAAPHNQLLTALLYGGIGAVALLFSIYASMMYFGLRYLRRTGSFALMSITTFIILHGMFETIIFAPTPDWRWLYLWVPPGLAAATELYCRHTTISNSPQV